MSGHIPNAPLCTICGGHIRAYEHVNAAAEPFRLSGLGAAHRSCAVEATENAIHAELAARGN